MDACDWDTPLPSEKGEQWVQWRNSLKELQHLQVLRPYVQAPLQSAQCRELCVFSDGSVRALAAVAYLRFLDGDRRYHSGFILGKAKLAPHPDYSILRLELCAAVLAANMAELITSEMDIQCDTVTFFTDSKFVLGYIYNEKSRFYVFVNNRVQRIRRCSHPQQWHYVSSVVEILFCEVESC